MGACAEGHLYRNLKNNCMQASSMVACAEGHPCHILDNNCKMGAGRNGEGAAPQVRAMADMSACTYTAQQM
eukprot:13316-Pelagomonas_calceolata.AAC.1